MKDSNNTVKIRMTESMKLMEEDIVDNNISRNKKEFREQSVENNIKDISEMVSGQKNIREFATKINRDVDWIAVQLDDVELNTRLSIPENLSEAGKLDIDEGKHDMLNSCSRSTKMSKSGLIRVCMIKELHRVKENLCQTDALQIQNRWLAIKRKLDKANDLLIDKLHYAISPGLVTVRSGRDRERTNVFYLKEHYNEFKDTKGFEYMEETENGRHIINVIEEAISMSDI
jgi:hypothetical protein